MSDEPSNKRRKMAYKKQGYQQKPKFFLEPGIKGFLATCNFREKDCVRECYNLLNEYADQNSENDEKNVEKSPDDAIGNEKPNAEPGTRGEDDDDDVEEEDISSQLEKEIKSANRQQKTNQNRFQQVQTKVPNCIFIRTTVEDPNELGVRILRDIFETKKRKTRMLLRFMPVDAVCRSNINDIKNTAGRLFDKVFLNTDPTSFAIIVNKRFNNDVDRMGIIRELADMISFKNSLHKVDLKNAKLTVVIEIVKGLCCISILPDYFLLKKYNVSELTNIKEDTEKTDGKSDEKGTKIDGEPKAVVESHDDTGNEDGAQVDAEDEAKVVFEADSEAKVEIDSSIKSDSKSSDEIEASF